MCNESKSKSSPATHWRSGAGLLAALVLGLGLATTSVSVYADQETTPAAASTTSEASASPPAAAAPDASAASTSAAAAPAPTAPYITTFDKISAGDTAWMLTSTALVLMMTIPGLALFYAG